MTLTDSFILNKKIGNYFLQHYILYLVLLYDWRESCLLIVLHENQLELVSRS